MGIFDRQILTGKIHALTPPYKRNMDFAKKAIEVMLRLSPRNYVSLSFGKQSLCLAHLVYQMAPETPMFFLASGESWCIHNFVEVIDAFMKHSPINLTIVQTNWPGLNIGDFIKDMKKRQPAIRWIFKGQSDLTGNWKHCRDLGDNDLAEMCNRQEWDGWFWGLAKDESRMRAITLSKKWEGQPHPSVFRYVDGKYRCCPLMFWRWEDIAAYISENNLKMLGQYEQLGLQTRTTARITKRMVGARGMEEIKHWNKIGYWRLVERFPEIRA